MTTRDSIEPQIRNAARAIAASGPPAPHTLESARSAVMCLASVMHIVTDVFDEAYLFDDDGDELTLYDAMRTWLALEPVRIGAAMAGGEVHDLGPLTAENLEALITRFTEGDG